MPADQVINEQPTNIYDVLIALIDAKMSLIRNTSFTAQEEVLERTDALIDEFNEDINFCLDLVKENG